VEPSDPDPPTVPDDPFPTPSDAAPEPTEAVTEPVGAVHDDTLVTPALAAEVPPSPEVSDMSDPSDLFAPPATPGAFSPDRPLTAAPVPPPPPGPIGGDLPPTPPSEPSPTSPRKAALMGALAGAVVAAVVASGVTVALRDDKPATASRTIITPVTTKDGAMDIGSILAKVQPSVVAIETSEQTSQGLFSGAGSGIILTSDGLVLTNAHVVSGLGKVTVVLSDGKKHDAGLVGSSPADDIAVVKINGVSGLVPADLGSSDALQVGEEVIAIGNALNLGGEPTVTRGIVSAKDRDLSAQGESLQGLIQTDAAINPGNSGGPLVNSAGQVVGMNTAIVADAQNLGFSIAIDRAKPIIKDLESGKGAVTPDQAFLGVSTTDVSGLTDAQRTQFDVKVGKGALVTEVVPRSGADAGGLEVGDVITKVDSKTIGAAADVRGAVVSHKAGDKIKVTVNRSGADRTLDVTLGSRSAGT
jgi:putative serine protease PepD